MSYPQTHFLYQRLTAFLNIHKKITIMNNISDASMSTTGSNTSSKGTPDKKGDKEKSQRSLKGLDLFQRFSQTSGKSGFGMDYFEGYITEYRKMMSGHELLAVGTKQKEKEKQSKSAMTKVNVKKSLRSLWAVGDNQQGLPTTTPTKNTGSGSTGVGKNVVVTPKTETKDDFGIGGILASPMITRAKRRSSSMKRMYLLSPKQISTIPPQSPRKTRSSNKGQGQNLAGTGGSIVMLFEEDDSFFPSDDDINVNVKPSLLIVDKPINTSTPKSPRGKRKSPMKLQNPSSTITSALQLTPISAVDNRNQNDVNTKENGGGGGGGAVLLKNPVERDSKNNDDGWDLVRTWSRKQIERVIKNLAGRLYHSNCTVPSPQEISQFVHTVKRNPSSQVLLPQLHFLEYLNCLRVKDIVRCTDSLRTSFDIRIKPCNSEFSKGTPYAIYNFALFYNQLGYDEDAMSSLEEAFRAGHASGDATCLHHCHNLWSSLHGKAYTDAILQSAKQHHDDNLAYLHSLNIFAHAFDCHYEGSPPAEVLHMIWHYNADCNLDEMEATLLTSLSTFFTMFGWHEMISFPCQMILNTKWKWSTRWYSYALCCLSQNLLYQGDLEVPFQLMEYGNEIFGLDSSPAGELFQLQYGIFKALMNFMAYTPVPNEVVATISAFCPNEAKYWQAYNLMIQNDWPVAAQKLNELYLKLDSTEIITVEVNDMKLRCLLLQAEIECLSENTPDALNYLTEALEISTGNYSDVYVTLFLAHIASIQCELGLVKTASITLESELRSNIRCVSPWLKARLNVIHVRVRLRLDGPVSKAEGVVLMGKLEYAENIYKKYQNNYRLKEIYYLKAELFDSSTDLQQNGSQFRKILSGLSSDLLWSPTSCIL